MEEKRMITMRVLSLVSCLSLTVGSLSGQVPSEKSFYLPSGVQLSVPASWIVANEGQLRAYENARDEALRRNGLDPPVTGALASVPFQAKSESAPGALSVMITILPSESSQDEVVGWRPDQIEKLGAALGEAQRKALAAAGVRDIVIGPAAIVAAGGKKAVFFTMSFSGPDGRRYAAEKYFIYTDSRTVIYTTQVSADRSVATAAERRSILASLHVE